MKNTNYITNYILLGCLMFIFGVVPGNGQEFVPNWDDHTTIVRTLFLQRGALKQLVRKAPRTFGGTQPNRFMLISDSEIEVGQQHLAALLSIKGLDNKTRTITEKYRTLPRTAFHRRIFSKSEIGLLTDLFAELNRSKKIVEMKYVVQKWSSTDAVKNSRSLTEALEDMSACLVQEELLANDPNLAMLPNWLGNLISIARCDLRGAAVGGTPGAVITSTICAVVIAMDYV